MRSFKSRFVWLLAALLAVSSCASTDDEPESGGRTRGAAVTEQEPEDLFLLEVRASDHRAIRGNSDQELLDLGRDACNSYRDYGTSQQYWRGVYDAAYGQLTDLPDDLDEPPKELLLSYIDVLHMGATATICPQHASSARTVIAALGAYISEDAPAETFPTTGAIVVVSPLLMTDWQGQACVAAGEFVDLREGAQVQILGPAGEVVALSELNASAYVSAPMACFWTFTAEVPAGLGFYRVSVLDRWSSDVVSEEELATDGVQIYAEPAEPLIDLTP